mmetsp:Transcript_53161/g.123764  ORF Transcript_53161/g.123764 Transcript_53161/m.123764 type:complete len:210 (+) Transcript_53161:431-1060(+)
MTCVQSASRWRVARTKLPWRTSSYNFSESTVLLVCQSPALACLQWACGLSRRGPSQLPVRGPGRPVQSSLGATAQQRRRTARPERQLQTHPCLRPPLLHRRPHSSCTSSSGSSSSSSRSNSQCSNRKRRLLASTLWTSGRQTFGPLRHCQPPWLLTGICHTQAQRRPSRGWLCPHCTKQAALLCFCRQAHCMHGSPEASAASSQAIIAV